VASMCPDAHCFKTRSWVLSVVPAYRLKAVSGSQGLMLEGTSPSLTAPGGPHWNCPDKEPQARLDTLAAAGEARIPFTTGSLKTLQGTITKKAGTAGMQRR
jgi:2-iminoacetate synthase ThiH